MGNLVMDILHFKIYTNFFESFEDNCVNECVDTLFSDSAVLCACFEIAESAEVLKLEECLAKYKALLAKQSPTVKLWLQYIEYIENLKLFIRAERSGN